MSHTPPEASGAPPYSALAAGYDLVMEHVDYALWAEHILDLLESFAPETMSLLELGCGTGTLALEVQAHAREFTGRPAGFRYLGTDAAEPMVRVAREKARYAGRQAGDLRFDVADFTAFTVEEAFDAVLLLYDGLNYLLEEGQIAALLARVHDALRPGGVFVLDQSTPANSINNKPYFTDEGEADAFAYVRRSHYDREARIHTTEFDLTVQGETYHERHVQRAYTLGEIRALIAASPLEEAAAFDGFSFEPATEETERVHWVLRRPEEGDRGEAS
jgi:SAM-dependent methyltransferase